MHLRGYRLHGLSGSGLSATGFKYRRAGTCFGRFCLLLLRSSVVYGITARLFFWAESG